MAEFFIIAFNYLPYWSHDQYFSSGNEDRFMSYMSLTVKNLADLITVPQNLLRSHNILQWDINRLVSKRRLHMAEYTSTLANMSGVSLSHQI